MDTITGKTLIDWGYSPGPWFRAATAAAEKARAKGGSEAFIREIVAGHAPAPIIPLRLAGEIAHRMNIRADDQHEADNIAKVAEHMVELMRVPTVRAGSVMPDACPAASAPGTIPVGGVIAAENAIHPGMHSADICCSMAITVFEKADPKALLDAGMKLSHFGGGGRSAALLSMPAGLLDKFEANRFLRNSTIAAAEHFGTQGDGNHFFYAGCLQSTGQTALVTHHGSRKPGAMLYKLGLQIAEKSTRAISPETPRHNAWIVADSHDGEDYWEALQIIRDWTKASHFAIHDRIADALGLSAADRFWNEHNFVFRKSDGLFYHAKGATPAWGDYAADASGLTLVPLNMAEPILITRGLDAESGLGFAPHGAGRNYSRTAFLRQNAHLTEEELIREQTKGIDSRYFCGVPDVSELPGAYKNAASVRVQIVEYGLAEIVDTVEPFGCIMAGDWQKDAPWRNKSARSSADRASDSESEGREFESR